MMFLKRRHLKSLALGVALVQVADLAELKRAKSSQSNKTFLFQ
jgi:hypothetical protein